MLTTVAAFREPCEAHMFCARLEAEGVPAFIAHEYHIGNAWFLSICLGEVKVQVPSEMVRDAQSIERRCRDGEFIAQLEHDFGDLEELRCPNCGSNEHWKRRPLARAVIALALFCRFGAFLPPIGWVYFCEKCNTKFRPQGRPNVATKWAMILLTTVVELFLLVVLFVALFVSIHFVKPRIELLILPAFILALWVRKKLADPPDTNERTLI
jgi:hypothetical protein